MFETKAFDGHESVHFFSDRTSGLKGIIAIHSTARGPAFGGCRVWSYADSEQALHDVLRLSRGMSFKNAVAGLPFGGGKAVIIRNAGEQISDAQFEAFGRIVDGLSGRYITAEDVGVSVKNMSLVARRTKFVSGLPHDGGIGGDPSPKTAFGVFCGIKAAVKARLGRDDLKGLRVAVQGLGSVGRNLCSMLHEAGAILLVADVNESAVAGAEKNFSAKVVSVNEILYQDVDVVSPCALGGILNADSIERIKAPVIAGGANNQLATDLDGQRLHGRRILYAPDFVINAGGIISAAAEYLQEFSEAEVMNRVAKIGATLADIFVRAEATNTPTNVVADQIARERLCK